MMDNIDIWRTARVMLDLKATAMVERGDLAGQGTWLRVVDAIGELEADATRAGNRH
jgi:hypothetical protein